MALRLVATRSRCHLIFPVKNFRNCIDLQKYHASTKSLTSQDFLRSLSALMMNKKPVKGFEKFYKDKKKAPESSEASKESAETKPPPSKSSESKSPKEFQKEFSFKFQIPTTGGGKGSSSGESVKLFVLFTYLLM